MAKLTTAQYEAKFGGRWQMPSRDGEPLEPGVRQIPAIPAFDRGELVSGRVDDQSIDRWHAPIADPPPASATATNVAVAEQSAPRPRPGSVPPGGFKVR